MLQNLTYRTEIHIKQIKISDCNLNYVLLLVETIPPIPQEGDTFHEFTTRENYPPPPYKKIR